MSAEAEALLAQLDALIDQREADLALAKADDAADEAAVAAAQLARDQAVTARDQAIVARDAALARANAAEADDVADEALLAQYRAQIIALGGTPGGPVTPPPANVLTATDAGGGNVDVSWSGGTQITVGRGGKDAGGYPADGSGWSTALRTPPGLTTAEVAAKKVRFTGMNTGVETTYYAVDNTGKRIEAKLKVASSVVTPPVTPPTGKKLWGCYNGYGPSGWASFNAKVGKRSTQHMSYLDTHDMSGLEDIISFIKAFDVDYKLSLNVLQGERGQFNSQAERDRCRAIFRRIHEAGVGHRIQIRHMYEKNAQYGFEWHSLDAAAVNRLFDDIVLIGREECPEMAGYVECMVPWDANKAEMERYRSKLPNIIGGLDNYNSWGQGAYRQRGDVGISFYEDHGQNWGWDEWANRTTSNNGYGDDPAFVTYQMQQTLRPRCVSNTIYDSTAGGVDMVLGANSLAEFKRQLVLVGAA